MFASCASYRYILRVVITQMGKSTGYEVNLTSFGLTPGLDCLSGFLKIKFLNLYREG